MEKYVKTIEVLESRIIQLEKELEETRTCRDIWFDECQELKKKYEPEQETE